MSKIRHKQSRSLVPFGIFLAAFSFLCAVRPVRLGARRREHTHREQRAEHGRAGEIEPDARESERPQHHEQREREGEPAEQICCSKESKGIWGRSRLTGSARVRATLTW